MLKVNKTEYLNNAQSLIEAKNAQIALKRDALSIDQFESEKELSKAIKSENNRIKENNSLLAALAFNDLSTVFHTHNIKIDELLNAKYANTREFKKRFLALVDAIASNDREKLLDVDDLLYSAIAAKRVKSELTLAKIQHVMSHKSTTQASYLANLAKYLNFAEVETNKAAQNLVKFNTESSFFKKIMNLYA